MGKQMYFCQATYFGDEERIFTNAFVFAFQLETGYSKNILETTFKKFRTFNLQTYIR